MNSETDNTISGRKAGISYMSGMKDSIPIALGYLPVSFGFGIMAAGSGIPVWAAVLISLTCVTSAGQVAGVRVMAAAGSIPEVVISQLIINMRYSLMSLSLSQKAHKSFTTVKRMLAAFGITDEIFAAASSKSGNITAGYMAGLITLPYLSWASGTFLGAFAGEILPEALRNALGIAIYGMFIAIIVPPSKKHFGVLAVTVMAIALSCTLTYVPVLSSIPGGFAIIICAVAASAAGAFLFPVKTEEEEACDD